jgi:C4-dicarboxylate transporter
MPLPLALVAQLVQLVEILFFQQLRLLVAVMETALPAVPVVVVGLLLVVQRGDLEHQAKETMAALEFWFQQIALKLAAVVVLVQ